MSEGLLEGRGWVVDEKAHGRPARFCDSSSPHGAPGL